MSRLSSLEEHAIEKFELPEGWRGVRFEAKPHTGDPKFVEITGAVCPVISRGRRKGRIDWAKRDRSTEATVTLTFDEHEAWAIEWEHRTGLCEECHGAGKVLAGWSKKRGCSYRACPKCEGTGKAKRPEVKKEEKEDGSTGEREV